ncbi:polyprenyl synthetase family protein [Paractinoplanes rishiriensis]|uniref:Dimethylallyltransferase n=1 Tax=Paractinoplanes rishiriensis TaxID=1050105 RepID=A0A919JUH9_9ACTN|nr:polyprenyl synthetase family protein [Actinoplanes rishiriensis]GIE95446.1 dimethylallyltransferase [Actinoplanes rishiriensis]
MTVALSRSDRDRALGLLAVARRRLQPHLRLAVSSLTGPSRTVAYYHLGWADRDGAPADRRSGKMLRGALAIACAQAAGGRAADAFDAATAVELVHNFSLLHDDVMDEDTTRRGVPTAWSVFGRAQAVLAGDALLTLAFAVLAKNTREARSVPLVHELCVAMLGLVEGQGADLEFERRTGIGTAECLAMSAAKTGALIAAACAMGAITAGAPPATVTGLREFGLQLGVAFQIADDLIGLRGDPAVSGKPVGADVARRKMTLPVVAAIGADHPAAARLEAVYRDHRPLSPEEIHDVTGLIERLGGGASAQAEMARRSHLAEAALASLPLDARIAEDLRAVLRMAVDRDH